MFQVVNRRELAPYARHQGKQVNSIDPDSDSLSFTHTHTHTHTQTRTNALGSETWNALDAFCIAPKVEDGELTHTQRHTGMENSAHTFFFCNIHTCKKAKHTLMLTIYRLQHTQM